MTSPPAADHDVLIEFYQSQNFAKAEELARVLTQRYASYSVGWMILGTILHQTGRTLDALMAVEKALALLPDDPIAHNLMGVVLRGLGRLEESLQSFGKAIRLKTDYAEAHNNLGIALKCMGRIDEAIASYRESIRLKPDYSQLYNNLGNALKSIGRIDEAVTNYRESIRLKPDFSEAYSNLANTLHTMGQGKEAEAMYRESIRLKPDFSAAHYHLSQLIDYQPNDPHIDQVMALLRQPNIFSKDKMALHFTAGNMMRDTGKNALAFHHYLQGNQLRKASLAYDIKTDRALFQKIKSLFLDPWAKPLITGNEATKLPVFILGMPRSGTSLVEQILSSHSKLYGAGELGLITQAIEKFRVL